MVFNSSTEAIVEDRPPNSKLHLTQLLAKYLKPDKVIADPTNPSMDKIEEGTPTQNGNKLLPQIKATIIANLTLLACGLAVAWTTPSLPILESSSSDLHLSKEHERWVVNAPGIGAIIGPLISALLLNYISRKWFLYITTVPFIICWVFIFLATSWVELCVGRFVVGLSIGSIMAIVPMYLGEVVETKIRGAACALIPVFVHIGQLIVFAVGPHVDRKMLAIICIIPTLVFMLTCFWLPESPYYYLKKKDKKRAELSLIWLRSVTKVQKELEDMEKLIEMEEKTSVKDLFVNKANRKAFLILLMLITGQCVSGYTAIYAYVGLLFQDLLTEFGYNNVLFILGALSVISSVVVTSLVDRCGRRPLYLASSYFSSLCLVVIGTYFLLDKMGMHLDNYVMVPVVVLVLYFLAFSFGLASIPAVVSSEIFPIGVKSWATMFASSYNASLTMVVLECYPLLTDKWGYYVAFYVFAGLGLVFSTIVAVYMPETSKKSFMSIQDMLKVTPEKKEKTGAKQ